MLCQEKAQTALRNIKKIKKNLYIKQKSKKQKITIYRYRLLFSIVL